MIQRLARSVAFARHIPPRQIVARLRLAAARRGWFGGHAPLAALNAGGLEPAGAVPAPFLPRTTSVERLVDGWRFTFLNRAIAMPMAIDWAAPGPGVVNQLWRMNLHYMEYLEGLDRDDGLALLRQWIASNPPWQPGYWHDAWNSYALSLRVSVWMQRLSAWGVERESIADVDNSLAAQISFLERNLEVDIGGNHLIKNIKALIQASVYYKGPLADHWRSLGHRLLAAELPRQILADGMHYERSPAYHCQVFADLIELRAALGSDGTTNALEVTLAKMAQATAMMAHPDGLTAQFNDAGLHMAYSPTDCLSAYVRVTGQPMPVPQPTFILPDAGFFGLNHEGMTLVADWGAIGPDDLPAHAHADIGSFELSIDGQRMIVDQGVFEYIPGDKRQRSRSAHAHNCLAIDGAEPADLYGAFRCGRRPHTWLTEQEIDERGIRITGQHDGYKHLSGRPILQREIDATPQRVTMRDRLIGRRWHAATARLLLHPECAINIDDNVATISRGATVMTITASAPMTMEPATWWPDMGHEIATHRLCLTLPPNCFDCALVIERASRGGSIAA